MRHVPFLLLVSVAITTSVAWRSGAAANATCSPDLWKPPVDASSGAGVQALLKDIPIATKWAEVSVATKEQLQKLAAERLAAFRARWARGALAKKEKILLECPTAEVTLGIDDYYRTTYNALVPQTFSLKYVQNAALARALVRNYLGTMAAMRASLTYPNGQLPNRDWDGKSVFDSIRLPDKETYEDIKNYNATVVSDLNTVADASLDDLEKGLKQRALFDARAKAVGAFSGDSFGGADMESACEVVSLNDDILGGYKFDKGRPRMFANDDEVLREMNALYLNNIELKWLDVGTLASALSLRLCNATGPLLGRDPGDDKVREVVGDPGANDVAKGMILLKKWWVERLSGSTQAKNKCTIYSSHDRMQIWEAFSADQHFNNDGSSTMDTYKMLLDTYGKDKTTLYRAAGKLALERVFPSNAVLTSAQREQVISTIDAEMAFGEFPSKIAAALDAAQHTTNGAAATAWNIAIAANVVRIGGKAQLQPNEEATIKAMFEEVKAWIGSQYKGYPIHIASRFPEISFEVDNTNNASTGPPGKIRFGLGTERSKLEYYSFLIHELRHAVYYAWKANAPDKSKVQNDEGPALEGSGVAAEALLLEPFAKQTLKNDTAYALYALDYGIRDARYVGTTDATLQRYFRSSCSDVNDLDTVDFSKSVAGGYGLTGELVENAALRAHAGTQYLQYIWGGLQVLDSIAYLQSQVDPSGQHRVDPYVLFACGLNTPRRDADYVSALKTCMEL